MTELNSRAPIARRGRKKHKNAGTSVPHAQRYDEVSAHVQNKLFEQLAIVGKAIASKQRLKLLELLAQTERTVEVLACEAQLSVANVSQHLQVLRAAGLVEATKVGLYVFYRLAGPDVFELLSVLRSVAGKRLAELDRLLRCFMMGPGELEPLTSAELLQRMKTGEVLVIDVRPVEEYASGHLPGAISVPLSQLERRLNEIPRNREIIAYCRGPYCLLAHRAVALLRQSGRVARRLRDGFPEWQAAGLPVEGAAKSLPPWLDRK
jgi:rhodanese-related sulfurtransferase/DNA-binding transcriptional ArsR family regulator